MAISPESLFNSPICFRDTDGSNPVYFIINAADPDGAADPQASATKGSLYFQPGDTDDTSQLYQKVADNDADADWQKVGVDNNEEAVSVEGDWTWDAANRINFRDTTLYIYSPAASTGAIALGATGDVWQLGDQAASNYVQFDFIGEATLSGSARFNARNCFEIYDDFIQQTFTKADTPWILNAGSDDLAVEPVIDAQECGVLKMTTGDDDGTTAVDGVQVVAHIPVQADSGGLVFEARLHINTAITNVSVFAGLTDITTLEEPFTNAADVVTSNATDAVGLLYDTDATTDEWWMCAVDGDADDAGIAATGTAPTADIYQKLRFDVSSDGNTIKFYIDGTLEGTFSGSNGVDASTNLYATIVACGDGTASKTVDVDYIYVGHNRA
jgi:hypothetical protein